jgi:hypothetical protein
MQIYEIARRKVNERILKGVRTTPPRNDRGRFMPVAATGAFNNMATQLQNQPATPAPIAAPTPAPIAAPTATTATPAKPVGLTPADMEKLRAQGTAQPATRAPELTARAKPAPAPAVLNKTPKAGFMRNAAEYLAKRTMDAAGIPQDQQGEYHPGGHQAALQGRSYGFIQKQEQALADKLSSEWVNDRTLAGQPVQQINANEIQSAADTLNRSSVRPLKVDLNAVTQATEKMIATKEQKKQVQKQARLTQKAQQQIDVENQIKKLQDELKLPNLTKADAQTKTNGILAQVAMLKSLGGDPNKIAGLADILTTTRARQPAPAPAPSTNQIRGNKPGSPTTQDYANLEKRLQQAMATQGQTQ